MVHMEKVHRPKKQLHKCHDCSGVEFESEILLNSHIATIHTSKIKCEICDFIFNSEAQLTLHKQLHKCHVCNAEFDRKCLVDSHVLWCSNKIKCNFCDLTFFSKHKLWNHVSKVHEKKKCHTCSAEFDSKFLLHSHIILIHKRTCEICDLGFISETQLKFHMDNDHKTKQPHKCQVCPEVCSAEFDSKILLYSHIESVHANKIRCEICDLCFISEAQLLKHMDKEGHKNSDILHKCHVCSTEFGSENLLNSHIASIHNKRMIHEGKEPPSCDICDWKAILNEDLTKHLEKSHNQIKCDKCNDSSYFKR